MPVGGDQLGYLLQLEEDILGVAADRDAPPRPKDVSAMDFVHDQLATGCKSWVLTVVDTFSRFSPAIDSRFS